MGLLALNVKTESAQEGIDSSNRDRVKTPDRIIVSLMSSNGPRRRPGELGDLPMVG